MNGRICTGLLILVISHVAAAQGFGPAVTIDDTEIPRAKIEAQVNFLVNERGLGSGGITQPSTYQHIQNEVIEKLIVQELLWMEAQRRDFVVSEAEVDAEMQRIKDSFENELTFQFKIQEGGFTEEEFRENIRQQRSVRKMIADDIVPSIEIDDGQIETFYQENIDKMVVPEQIRVRHILIELAPDADEAARSAAMAKIEAIRDELAKGASFALTAIEHSEDSSAGQGGDLGFFPRGQMAREFEEAAFALQPGEISGIVETRFGLHLIKLEDRIEASSAPLAEVAPQIMEHLGQQSLESNLEELVESLRAEHDVQVYLR